MNDLPFAPSPIPRHIAIVMDGNGRWAEERGRPRVFGHRAGAEAVRQTVRVAGEFGIEYLTLYAFSTENWKRPAAEVSALMTLLASYLTKETRELAANNVRLAVIGDRSRLPRKAQQALAEATAELRDNTGLTMVLALNYGARDEITRAVRGIAAAAVAGELAPDEITEELIAARLDTADIPDPELIIRTGGEMRLSNFLLWQASYAEYLSLPLRWPDFDRDALAGAIAEFQRRTRKFGGVLGK